MTISDLSSDKYRALMNEHLRKIKPCGSWIMDWLDIMESQFPDSRWSEFRLLPYDDEFASRSNWISNSLAAQCAIGSGINGIWVGISDVTRNNTESIDCYARASTGFSSNDDLDWVRKAEWTVTGKPPVSQVLAEIHEISYRDKTGKGLQSAGVSCLGLMYTAALSIIGCGHPIHEICDSQGAELLVGFDSGDWLSVARIFPHGMIVQPSLE